MVTFTIDSAIFALTVYYPLLFKTEDGQQRLSFVILITPFFRGQY